MYSSYYNSHLGSSAPLLFLEWLLGDDIFQEPFAHSSQQNRLGKYDVCPLTYFKHSVVLAEEELKNIGEALPPIFLDPCALIRGLDCISQNQQRVLDLVG